MHNTIYIGNLGDAMAPIGPQVDPPLFGMQALKSYLKLDLTSPRKREREYI
jgi:hypothetical protein